MKYRLFKEMKLKCTTVVLILGGMLTLGVNAALAQNNLPSSKQTADISSMVVCKMSQDKTVDVDIDLPASCTDIFNGQSVPTDSGGWVKIMEKPLKIPNSNSLFVNVSLVTGLYTQTATKTNTATLPTTVNSSTSTAMGGVYLRAVVEDAFGNKILASPLNLCSGDNVQAVYGCFSPTNGAADSDWGVILNARVQTLTQALSNCVVNVTVPTVGDVVGACTLTSTIDLILNTTSAHSFNFIFENLGRLNGSGIYTIKVYAAVGTDAKVTSGSGAAVGAAVFGLGSMTAEKVRLVNGFDFN